MKNKVFKKLLIFDIYGKFACWKRFFSNSTNITSFIPSRTHLIGILASILELKRDSYYNLFNLNDFKISVSIKSELGKTIQQTNFISEKGRTPKRIEMIIPKDFRKGVILYRIYVLANEDSDDFKELIKRIKENQLGFGIYLGQRQFRGDIDYVDCFEITKEDYSDKETKADSIINISNLEEDYLDLENSGNLFIENTSLNFNKNRELEEGFIQEIVYAKDMGPIKSKKPFKKILNVTYRKGDKEIRENIAFFENEF